MRYPLASIGLPFFACPSHRSRREHCGSRLDLAESEIGFRSHLSHPFDREERQGLIRRTAAFLTGSRVMPPPRHFNVQYGFQNETRTFPGFVHDFAVPGGD
jgi:hypothetical protein